ncbi:hypothetical protein RND81_13G100400 [Saponaria officinalis]|uniref:Endonuclease/exonuclease/phosphatase domain-containing protein n=1 Tax=Saponaria officinalis TaxID=3572 RepID=A0AAW1GYS5_SAPOF
MIISSWNIRGLNDPLKQVEVKFFLRKYKVDVLGLLETRVREHKAAAIFKKSFSSYKVINNYSHHCNGRIWVIYNPRTVTISSTLMHDQLILLEVLYHATNSIVSITIVYGSNSALSRSSLWNVLRDLSVGQDSWLVLGDFNIVKDFGERLGPNPLLLNDVLAFNQCILDCALEDVHSTSCVHT